MAPEDSGFVGVVLEWTLWEGGHGSAAADAEGLQADAAAAQREALAADLRLQVEQRYLAFEAARSSASAAETSEAAAEEAARAAREQFDVGELDAAAALDAEVRLLAAQAGSTRARAEAMLSLAALRQALGEPYQAALSSAELRANTQQLETKPSPSEPADEGEPSVTTTDEEEQP